MVFSLGLGILLASLTLEVVAQSVLLVNVGFDGNFFDPPTISAQQGDIVSFVFGGRAHTVTQSTFEDPCLPLPGGFSSGQAGSGPNAAAPIQVWNLTITNTTGPIWFFCEIVQPASHCASGQVGMINPPSQANYSAFVEAAKAVTGTPSPTLSVALTGQGAFATQAPVATATALPSNFTTSTFTFASSTSPVSSSTAASSSKTPVGPIVGGVVGGVAALAIIGVLAFLLFRAKKQRSRRSSAVDPTPPTAPKPRDPESIMNAHVQRVPSPLTPPPPMTMGSVPSMSEARSSDLRSSAYTDNTSQYGKYEVPSAYYTPTLPTLHARPQPPPHHHAASDHRGSGDEVGLPPVQLNALARQVAALINQPQQASPVPVRPGEHDHTMLHPEGGDSDPASRVTSPGPPRYASGY